MVLGVFAGIMLWGGFNAAMEATNSMSFCVSCHEMRENVFKEYAGSSHYANASGVRATCSDCHVPRDWTHKVVRKVQATNELFAKLAGTIDTPEKFEARRLDLARHEWKRMRENDSRECRNCHSFEAMDFGKQPPKAAAAMQHAMTKQTTCIDCHKGLVHRMPDLTARYKAQFRDIVARAVAGDSNLRKEGLLTFRPAPLHAAPAGDAQTAAEGMLAPLTPVKVLNRQGAWAQVEARGWQREGSEETLFAALGKRIPVATLDSASSSLLSVGVGTVDPDTEETWTEAVLKGWIKVEALTADTAAVSAYGVELHEALCSTCHGLHAPASVVAAVTRDVRPSRSCSVSGVGRRALRGVEDEIRRYTA